MLGQGPESPAGLKAAAGGWRGAARGEPPGVAYTGSGNERASLTRTYVCKLLGPVGTGRSCDRYWPVHSVETGRLIVLCVW